MPLSDRRGSGRTPRRSRGPGGDAGLRGRSPPSDGRHRRKSSLSKPRGRRSSPSKPRGRKIVEVKKLLADSEVYFQKWAE
jgi:hypothetical protein